jgi:hypothetical protein
MKRGRRKGENVEEKRRKRKLEVKRAKEMRDGHVKSKYLLVVGGGFFLGGGEGYGFWTNTYSEPL